MGLFWESAKEREEREARGLEAILRAFETQNLDPNKATEPNKQKTVIPPKAILQEPAISPAKTQVAPVNVNDLAKFLADKGIINLNEWELYSARNKPKT